MDYQDRAVAGTTPSGASLTDTRPSTCTWRIDSYSDRVDHRLRSDQRGAGWDAAPLRRLTFYRGAQMWLALLPDFGNGYAGGNSFSSSDTFAELGAALSAGTALDRLPVAVSRDGGMSYESGEAGRLPDRQRWLEVDAATGGTQRMRLFDKGSVIASWTFSAAEATALGAAIVAGTGTGP